MVVLVQNMGQRMLELQMSYTGNSDGSATLHVNQMPPNPSMFPPGPARKCLRVPFWPCSNS